MARVRKTKEKANKTRLSIPLSETIYKMLETEADKIGISISAYTACLIGEIINQKKEADNNHVG